MRIHYVLLIILLSVSLFLKGQQKVSFYTTDSLKITADLYLKNHTFPYILLFHQSEYSRGEYTKIAQKLTKLNYNCLAVDLRVGNEVNYVRNETAIRAKEMKAENNFIDAKKDIIAAIEYIKKKSNSPVILFGSSFSASLCLWIARDNPSVEAVIACSPGEFFYPEINIRKKITGLNKPIFVTSTPIEYSYIVKMLSGISDSYKTIIKSNSGNGTHGAKIFWNSTPDSETYWLELMLFFKKIKET